MHLTSRNKIFGACLCTIVIFLSACSRVTPENLDKVKEGMTTSQVRTILGDPSDTKTQGALTLNSTTFTYKRGASEITIVFLNDKVIAKSGTLK